MNLTFELKELLSILNDPEKTKVLKDQLKKLYIEGFGFVLPEPNMNLLGPESLEPEPEPDPEPEKEMPKQETPTKPDKKEKAKKSEKVEKSETIVKNDVLKAVKAYLVTEKENVNASDTLKAIFAKYNAKRVSELKEANYAAFLNDLENTNIGATA